MPVFEVNDKTRQRRKRLDEQRRPITGDHAVQTVTNVGLRTILARLYEEWTVHVEYASGATGTVILEGTQDSRADVNLTEGQFAGNPEENVWNTLGTVSATGRIDQPVEVYNLIRVRGNGITGVVTTTFVARQFAK